MRVRIKKSQTRKVQEAIDQAEHYLASVGSGLTKEQVESRYKEGLSNKTKKPVNKTYFKIFRDNFLNFFNVLLIAIMILMLVAGIRSLTSYIFAFIMALSAGIGLFFDIRARRLVDRMRLITDPKAKVIRDGNKQEIPIEEVVLDDIVYLDAGDQIPCDCVLLDGRLTVDESLLTGESDPIEKKRGDGLYGASYVKAGHAYVRATKVGPAAYSESLRNSAQEFRRPKSEIKRSTFAIFLITGLCAVITGVAAFIDYFASGGEASRTFYDFVTSLSGMMVAMIPSGLYLLTSMTLAVGIVNLAKKRTNVQELYCIEMLARVDTICFDKTGTLTEGHLDVDDIIPLGKKTTKGKVGAIAYSLVKATGDNNATAEAILRTGEGQKPMPYGAVLPFDSSKKYSAADLLEEGCYALGAYGYIPSKPDAYLSSKINEMAEKGQRVLVLYRVKKIKEGEVIGNGEPIGLICLRDAIKKDAAENIKWFVDNGVAIKVISGDDPMTVSRIAEQVGVPNAHKAISLANIPIEKVGELVDSYSVFGRVSPEQKAALVEAMQQKGHKVAMTGDGVNDILALKKADCSIAMASGSPAARNVSHLVAMDNDFGHLPEVVAEGRRVINNLQRTASLFLTKTTFAIVLGVFFLISSWFGGSPYPFSTQNMIIWEIFSIGVAAFFLSLQPSKERLQGSFIKNVLSKAVPAGFGAIFCVFVIYFSNYLAPGYIDLTTARTLSVIAFSCFSFVVLYSVSLPLSRYRIFVFVSMLVLSFLVAGLDVYTALNGTGTGKILGLDYTGTTFNIGTLALLVVLVITVSAAFVFGESYAEKRRLRKGEAKQ